MQNQEEATEQEKEQGQNKAASNPVTRRIKRDAAEDGEKRRSVDCSTLTELHSSKDVPEVEVISLLGEDLPKYRLKADYISSFAGLANDDFVSSNWSLSSPIVETPVLSEEAAKQATGLSADQVKKIPQKCYLTMMKFISSARLL